MKKALWMTAVALAVACGWGVLIASAWKPYLDPLTGFGLAGYIQFVGFHVVLAAIIAIAFLRRWHLPGAVITALALFLAPPLPSKRGVDVVITNGSAAQAEVKIARVDNRRRQILITIPPGQTVRYRSAPGDYSENLQFELEHGNLRLTVPVGSFRKQQVRLTGTEILRADITK